MLRRERGRGWEGDSKEGERWRWSDRRNRRERIERKK